MNCCFRPGSPREQTGAAVMPTPPPAAGPTDRVPPDAPAGPVDPHSRSACNQALLGTVAQNAGCCVLTVGAAVATGLAMGPPAVAATTSFLAVGGVTQQAASGAIIGAAAVGALRGVRDCSAALGSVVKAAFCPSGSRAPQQQRMR